MGSTMCAPYRAGRVTALRHRRRVRTRRHGSRTACSRSTHTSRATGLVAHRPAAPGGSTHDPTSACTPRSGGTCDDRGRGTRASSQGTPATLVTTRTRAAGRQWPPTPGRGSPRRPATPPRPAGCPRPSGRTRSPRRAAVPEHAVPHVEQLRDVVPFGPGLRRNNVRRADVLVKISRSTGRRGG